MKEMREKHGCFRRLLIAGAIVLGLIIFIFISLAINQHFALARTREMFPPPGELIEVDGHWMHLDCKGEGTPTVVIDAGNGSFSVEWMPIQEKLSQNVRVCVYDRSGYGWSEPGPEPRDAAQTMEELHTLLQAAGESGPFLLVGHSLGGEFVRYFAGQYPADTAGLILVDTAYPLTMTPAYEAQIANSIGFYQVMRFLTRSGIMRILGPLGGENSIPVTAQKLPSDLQEMYLNLLLDPLQYHTAIKEMETQAENFNQINQLITEPHNFGDLPLIVITAGKMVGPGSTPFDEAYINVPEERISDQALLAAISSHGEQRIVPDSGHAVHLDAPDKIIEAVLDIVATIHP